MPIFELKAPDGRTFEVDAPDQAAALDAFRQFGQPAASKPRFPGTPVDASAGAQASSSAGSERPYLDRIETALRNADAAGDAEAAKALAGAYQAERARMQQGETAQARQQFAPNGVPVGDDVTPVMPGANRPGMASAGPARQPAQANGLPPLPPGFVLDEPQAQRPAYMDDPSFSIEQKRALALASARRRRQEGDAVQGSGEIPPPPRRRSAADRPQLECRESEDRTAGP